MGDCVGHLHGGWKWTRLMCVHNLWARFMRCLSKILLCVAHHLGGIFLEVPRIPNFVITFELSCCFTCSPLCPLATSLDPEQEPGESISLPSYSEFLVCSSTAVSLGNLLNVSKLISSRGKLGCCEDKGNKWLLSY